MVVDHDTQSEKAGLLPWRIGEEGASFMNDRPLPVIDSRVGTPGVHFAASMLLTLMSIALDITGILESGAPLTGQEKLCNAAFLTVGGSSIPGSLRSFASR